MKEETEITEENKVSYFPFKKGKIPFMGKRANPRRAEHKFVSRIDLLKTAGG